MKRIFPVLLIAALTACNESPLLPEGSLSATAGTLSLTAVHHLSDDSALAAEPDGSKMLTNDLGFRITLMHAEIHFHRLTLVSSGDDPECTGGNDATLALSGTDDLLSDDLVETDLGDHAIPLASFCSYEIAMELHLEGNWSKDGGSETEFEIESEEVVTTSGIFEHPLHFHEGETETAKSFGVKYDVLFDGIDFQNDTLDTLHTKTAANLETATHVHTAH